MRGRSRRDTGSATLNARAARAPARHQRARTGVIANPKGAHAVAVGLDAPITRRDRRPRRLLLRRHEQAGEITVDGNAGAGVAENMMSGSVRVAAMLSQSAGATGRGGLLVIEGDASSRCGISMKGVDIVVQRLGRPHERVHGPGRQSRRAAATPGEALGDSIYEARIYVRGKVESLGADCVEKPMRDEHTARRSPGCSSRAGIDGDSRSGSAATARPVSSTISTSTTLEPTDGPSTASDSHASAQSATFDDYTLSEIRRAAATGIYDIRGGGAKRRLPHFDDLLFLGASHLALPARGLPREVRHRRLARHPPRQEADPPQDPDHHRRHELRLAVGARPRRRSAAAPRDGRHERRPPATAA